MSSARRPEGGTGPRHPTPPAAADAPPGTARPLVDVPNLAAPRFRFRAKLSLALACITLALSMATILLAYRAAMGELRVALGGQLMTIASSAAIAIDGDAFDRLHEPDQMTGSDYRQIQAGLRRLRAANRQVPMRYLYTMRPGPNDHWLYVVDSETEGTEDFSALGEVDDDPTDPVLRQGLASAAVSEDFKLSRRWGNLLTAAAPIRNRAGRVVGVVGVDAAADAFWSLSQRFRRLVAACLALAGLLSLLGSRLLARGLTQPIALLMAAAEAIARGEFEGPLHVAGQDELGALARMFQYMADQVRLRERSLEQAKLDTLQRLALAAEYKDTDTAAHIRRMSAYAALLARRAGLTEAEVRLIELASPMHDVGKIGVPDQILLKAGGLTEAEWQVMREHTTMGARLLQGSTSELLQAAEVIARTHHERWDGGGYPNRLAGEDIPLSGRICAVADVYDALTSARPYKPAYTPAEARRRLLDGRGTHFDPHLVDLFLQDPAEVEAIGAAHRDRTSPISTLPTRDA